VPEPTFSFIVPTRGRPDGLRRLCDSIRTKTRRLDETEIVLVVDSDDEDACRFEYSALNIHKVEGAPGRSMGELNMAGYRAARGRYLMLLNDDVIIGTPAWDDHVLEVFQSYRDGIVLVHVNETIFRETLCTFPFLTRTFCELAGGICQEGYLRYRIDDHIHNVFDLLTLLGHRRRIFLPDVVFQHLNLTETAEGHAYVVDPEIQAIDTRRFDALLPERKRLALAAMEVIERHRRSQNPRVWETKLEAVCDSVAIRDPAHARWHPALQAPDKRPRVTVAVVSADIHSEHAQRCIELVKANTRDYDLVIVDNNRDQGFNHAREMNRVLEFCRTDYLVLLDDDVFVEEGWAEGLMRAMGPRVGVVTPVHKNRHGDLSYAGVVMQPDDSGHHTHVMSIGTQPQHIQTLCSAVMLIDMNRCGHVRFDEVYSKYFLDIDYGLRIWEEGWCVVCSPWARVTHIGGGTLAQGSEQAAPLFEAQRRHWVSAWVDTCRIHALRRGIWKDIPELVEISMLKREIDLLFFEGSRLANDAFFTRARSVFESLSSLPALKNYVAGQARKALGGHLPRADDPQAGGWAILLGLSGQQPVLYEAGVRGMNIVIWNSRFYALPADEGAFEPGRAYSRSYEAAEPQVIRAMINDAPPFPRRPPDGPTEPIVQLQPLAQARPLRPRARGTKAAVKRLVGALRYASVLRPRIPIRLGRYLFDSGYYRAAYPDVADNGVSPLLHFIVAGAFEGRNPHPLFDTAFYLSKYPDVAAAGVNPLGHYLKHGAAEGRQPHPLFDSSYYLERYPDVRKSGINPLLHYELHGAAEGRQPHPWFQPDYYLDRCPEARRASVNPLVHFAQADPGKCRSPHPRFDCEYYARQNPGVAAAGMNPLVHYVLFGAPAGRRPSPSRAERSGK
jgi:GT2 family glycosyltransferase